MPKIIQRIIPNGSANKPNRPMAPEYITIHNTDNPLANAEAHSRYLLNGSGGSQKSWTFTVDDTDEIYQHLSVFEQGWHAGDGGGTGNTKSIGIEVCNFKGINQAKAEANLVWLVVMLMKQHCIPLTNVVPHKHWSGKQCPSTLLPRWDKIMSDIKQALQQGPFTDVQANHWAAAAIQKAKDAGLMSGYPDGTFKPNHFVTRAELATILANLK
ncbi:N-acetylmuramoyl-L-alanine amidase [Ammoniphilus sp. YIM 78166]|uniref:N-acetylmuramoyl-L-alanine amidase n=1 Tax=Ammoniphilus sp. YIM 78166 TaxID=1644106 RepID=UPI001F1159E7|nr:N-acetylmuramoyl-L-alanine amidase [Ammoniphilus sp. YIM 78166]